MPIQYTPKALEQLKKLREELETVRKSNYMSQAVVTFKTIVNYALQDIFQNGCENSIWQEFERQSNLANFEANCGRLTEEKRQWPFNFLAGKLDGYIKTIEMGIERRSVISERTDTKKSPKIFISHSSRDGDAAKLLVDLIEGMGIPDTAIYCTSAEGLGVSLRENIYSSMRKQFDGHNLFVLFLLSENYYHSPACLNEMGATWILQLPETSILLPGFDFERIKGAVDPRCIGIKLDITEASGRLTELREQLCNFIGINIPTDARSLNRWDSKKIDFLRKIKELPQTIEVNEKDAVQRKNLELEEKVRQLEDNQTWVEDSDSSGSTTHSLVPTINAKNAISMFEARPNAWNGKSFVGTFFIGGGLKDSYAVPMSDWLCQELKLDPGYPVTAKCVECESNKKIEVFATEDNADILSVIDTLSVIELQLKTVYFTYEDYDNCSFGSPEVCPYFIFEVEKVLSVKAYEQPALEPF